MATDFIAVLYVGNNFEGRNPLCLDRSSGFTVRSWDPAAGNSDFPKDFLPDIILTEVAVGADGQLAHAEQLIARLKSNAFAVQPAFFGVMETDPGIETRRILHALGYEHLFVKPLEPDDIRARARVFLDRRHLSQERDHLSHKLEKAFRYLDVFKQELAGVKEELIQERNSLNNALKQIQHMTRERSGLKKQIKTIQNEREDNLKGFQRVLSDLIRRRVERNQGHNERVSAVARFIGRRLKIGEKKLEDLAKAAMLHEIGLFFMPESGLGKKNGRMTPFESDIQMQYPVKGAELLSRCQGFEAAAGIIRHIHENADGTGLPGGLKKRHIPLPSRILAGADVFDTLKDDPDINGLQDLLAALETVSGSRLDPMVVNHLHQYAVLHMGTDAYKVRGVGVEQLEPGMRLGCALFTATGTKLFSADTLLTKTAINKIIRYNREYPVDETVYVRV